MRKRVINPMADVFKYLAISILFMFIGFGFGVAFVPKEVAYYGNFIIMLLILMTLIMAIFSRKSIIPRSFSMNFVYLFTFIDGILMYPVLQLYLQNLGVNVVINVLLTTIILFGVLSYVSNKKEPGHYLGWGQTLFIFLIVTIISFIINIFIGSSAASIFISMFSIVVFSGYILYDISAIKDDISRGYITDKNDLSVHVLDLYLDFINIFLDLLNILWELKD